MPHLPRIQRRWACVYSEVGAGPALYHRSEPEPGIVLLTAPGGRGMTCSPAIAEETFSMTAITVACLDMAGTTVPDDGTVIDAFTSAIAAQNLPPCGRSTRP